MLASRSPLPSITNWIVHLNNNTKNNQLVVLSAKQLGRMLTHGMLQYAQILIAKQFASTSLSINLAKCVVHVNINKEVLNSKSIFFMIYTFISWNNKLPLAGSNHEYKYFDKTDVSQLSYITSPLGYFPRSERHLYHQSTFLKMYWSILLNT